MVGGVVVDRRPAGRLKFGDGVGRSASPEPQSPDDSALTVSAAQGSVAYPRSRPAPTTNTSTLFVPALESAAGAVTDCPPTGAQPLHLAPSQNCPASPESLPPPNSPR